MMSVLLSSVRMGRSLCAAILLYVLPSSFSFPFFTHLGLWVWFRAGLIDCLFDAGIEVYLHYCRAAGDSG